MRSTKLFSASIFIVVCTASVFADDFWFNDSTHALDLSTTFTFTTQSTASISGRIKTPEGKPIRSALVVLKDADSNQVVRSTFSSNFGYYQLQQVETGRSYVLSVSHKRYLFVFPAQLLEINADQAGLDFTGEKTRPKNIKLS